jgi:hypothetical protein
MVTPCTYYRSGTAQFSWQFDNGSLTGIFFLHFLVPSRRREGKTLAAARAAPPTSLPLSPVATRPGFVRARPARCRRGECSSPLERVYDVGCYPIFSKRSREYPLRSITKIAYHKSKGEGGTHGVLPHGGCGARWVSRQRGFLAAHWFSELKRRGGRRLRGDPHGTGLVEEAHPWSWYQHCPLTVVG